MKRILIIDDEEKSYLSLRTVLENNGLTVDSSNNPHEALKNFSTGLYDLVLVDIIMPEMNGFELYRRLRIIDNKVKVFFLASGRVNYAMVRKELSPESDSNYIIRKPIENEDLIELLNIIVNQVVAAEEDDEDEEKKGLEAILYTLFISRYALLADENLILASSHLSHKFDKKVNQGAVWI